MTTPTVGNPYSKLHTKPPVLGFCQDVNPFTITRFAQERPQPTPRRTQGGPGATHLLTLQRTRTPQQHMAARQVWAAR